MSRFNGFRTLDINCISVVLSYLDSATHVEVARLNRHWETAVIQGTGECSEVTVYNRGVNPDMYRLLANMLRTSTRVTICDWESDTLPVLLRDNLGNALRVLTIEGVEVDPIIFDMLSTQCPHLRVLTLDREPSGSGDLHFSHDRIESIEFVCISTRKIDIRCISLRRLSTCGDSILPYTGTHRCQRDDPFPLSLECPVLEELMLSTMHSVDTTMEDLIPFSPTLERLQVYFCEYE